MTSSSRRTAGATLAVMLIAGSGVVAASAGAHAVAASRTTEKPAVRIAQTVGGPLLVNAAGQTVFMFTRNGHRLDRCAKIKNCLTDWPAVTTTRRPAAGPGVKRSLLGSIPLHGKVRQVTYDGYPLHTYLFDVGKGSTMAIGNRQFGGSWYGLRASGKLVR